MYPRQVHYFRLVLALCQGGWCNHECSTVDDIVPSGGIGATAILCWDPIMWVMPGRWNFNLGNTIHPNLKTIFGFILFLGGKVIAIMVDIYPGFDLEVYGVHCALLTSFMVESIIWRYSHRIRRQISNLTFILSDTVAILLMVNWQNVSLLFPPEYAWV